MRRRAQSFFEMNVFVSVFCLDSPELDHVGIEQTPWPLFFEEREHRSFVQHRVRAMLVKWFSMPLYTLLFVEGAQLPFLLPDWVLGGPSPVSVAPAMLDGGWNFLVKRQ